MWPIYLLARICCAGTSSSSSSSHRFVNVQAVLLTYIRSSFLSLATNFKARDQQMLLFSTAVVRQAIYIVSLCQCFLLFTFFFFFAGSVYQRSHLYCAFLEFFFFFIVVVKQFYSCLLLFQIVKPHWSMNFYCGGIFLSALQKLGLFCADHSNTILIRNIEIRGFHET